MVSDMVFNMVSDIQRSPGKISDTLPVLFWNETFTPYVAIICTYFTVAQPNSFAKT